MSSRALRKAQREKEEQERLKQLEAEARALEDDSEEEEPAYTPATKKSAFAMLQEELDEPAADEEEDDDPLEDESPVAPTTSKSSSKKKKKKKKAKATAKGTEEQQDDLDEIDAALKDLSANGKSAQLATTAAGVDPAMNEASRLLAIDTNHLHAQNEMRRLFGRAALHHDEEEQEQPEGIGGNRRQQRRGHQVGLAQALRGQRQDGRSGLSAMALRRNIFMQGKEEWPVATSGGLGMEVEEKRTDGTVLYKFVHNATYQDVQSQFELCVATMDPNRLVALLQMNSYHISTLLQVSEIAKQERDHATSGDLLERALFSFGRAVHSTFAKNLMEGKARLDFRRAENREFWLASWRYMQNLTMRATYRTVYEWAKLLLSLSPDDDPYSLWLVLDQYALRSKQDLDYLNVSRNPILKPAHHDMPNVQLSQGLAEYRAGNRGKGQQALFSAVGKFPWVVARIMQELNLDPPPGVWGKEPRTAKEKLYTELYATRAKDLWNTPETSNLLVEIASALPPETPAAPIDADEIALNEARHVLLSDTPALISLVPRKFTSQLESASDPLPPDNAFSSSSQRNFDSIRNASTTSSSSEPRNLNRLVETIREWYLRPPTQGTNEQEGAAENTDHPANTLEEHLTHEQIMQFADEAGVSVDQIGSMITHIDRAFGGESLPVDEVEEDNPAPNQAHVEDAPEDD